MNGWPIKGKIVHILLTTAVAVISIILMPSAGISSLLCNDCHGTRNPADIRPLDDSSGERNPVTGGFRGSHRSHLPGTSTPNSCEPCHAGSSVYTSDHRNALISLAANLNTSPLGTKYRNTSTANPFPQRPDPVVAK